jgi:hypothetical protein
MLTQVMERSAQRSGSSAAPLGEAAMPLLCYRLTSAGVLQEGFELELNHPASKGTPAMFMGEYYISRHYTHGCLFDRWGSAGIVRRAIIEQAGTVKVLSQPNGGNPPFLLHVNPIAELVPGAKPLEIFYIGVNGGRTVAQGQDCDERIVAFDDGTSADIYYSDGRVIRVVREHGALVLRQLNIMEQAGLRIAHAKRGIADAETLPRELRIKRTDRWYHELIAILAVGGNRSDLVFDEVYGILEAGARNGAFAQTVQEHATTVLSRRWPSHAVRFGLACQARASQSAQKAGGAFGSIFQSTESPRGIPLDALKRKRERAERDRQERAASKGPSGGGSQKSNQGQKGKKAKK